MDAFFEAELGCNCSSAVDYGEAEVITATGLGRGYREGFQIKAAVVDPEGLAKEIYAICPDIVDQGFESVEGLAAHLRSKGLLFMWWD